MARSMTSLGRASALALFTARRRREFMAGSGRPILAATVISRESLENSLERAESARPLRCMMFLNLECPAMVRFSGRDGMSAASTLGTASSEPLPCARVRPDDPERRLYHERTGQRRPGRYP